MDRTRLVTHGTHAGRSRLRLMPMRPRDPEEPGRTATPLELFFDLVFVVAVSIASAELHHTLAEGRVIESATSYAMVFFAIWWAWMNFTWFATSFATDDWLYRVLTIVQMAGALVLAAGIRPAFVSHDYALLVVAYVVMRTALVAQWTRAAHADGPSQPVARAYAIGIATAQLLWIGMLSLPRPAQNFVFIALILVELAIPVIAERRGVATWHPHHIAERYGLFTIIVLGESILASVHALTDALHHGVALIPLTSLAILTLITAAALWWIYFWAPQHRLLTTLTSSLRYGYAHYVIFAATGALSAGIELQIDALAGAAHVDATTAAHAVSIPIALVLVTVWWIAIRPHANRTLNAAMPVAAFLVLLDPLVPVPFLTVGTLIAIVVLLVFHSPATPGGGTHRSACGDRASP